MPSLLSKERRITLKRQISSVWEVYSRNKIGMFGMILVLGYVFLAIFAPWLTPYDPITDTRLAEGFAMPDWVRVFPQYSNLPKTNDIRLDWGIMQASPLTEISWGKVAAVEYRADKGQRAEVYLAANFTYTNNAPHTFYLSFHWAATKVQNASYSLETTVVATNGTSYRLWSAQPSQIDDSGSIQKESTDFFLLTELGLQPVDNLAHMVFQEPGNVSIVLHISFRSTEDNAQAEVSVTDGRFMILGLVHGILGADHVGADLFSQLIYGVRISLEIGIAAAVVSTVLGVTVGVISGYLGGGTDEILMRAVDILICLPVLPLLLALIYLFGANVWLIVLLIAVFGWLGLSRVVRSQVLYLREMAFVECAKASGASKLYIMFRHLVPNVWPIAFAALVLDVPGAIITEAVLSFLGFGDPSAPTWGRMLNHAFGFGAFGQLAWWWILPPGLMITILCLSFVFIGHAIDEIINPRLRLRK